MAGSARVTVPLWLVICVVFLFGIGGGLILARFGEEPAPRIPDLSGEQRPLIPDAPPPTSTPPETAPEAAESPPAAIEEEIDIWPARHLFVSVRGYVLDAATRAFLKDLKPGGVVLMQDNIRDETQTRELIKQIKEAVGLGPGTKGIADLPLIAIDQEGGPVNRLDLKNALGAREMGLKGDPALAAKTGVEYGKACLDRGIGVLLAPVMDVYDPAGNTRLTDRCFGDDSEMVTALGLAFAKGAMESGVLPIAKHFPGHGSPSADSHKELAILTKEGKDLDAALAPFKQAAAWGIPGMMPGHIAAPALDAQQPERPATLSPPMLVDLLRTQWGYTGVVISDDLAMKAITESKSPETAAVEALIAGNDAIICLDRSAVRIRSVCRSIQLAVDDGRIPRNRLIESAQRLDKWQEWLRKPVIPEAPLPQAPGAPAASATSAPPGGETLHTVAPGESLSKIAVKYGVSQSAIRKLNKLASPELNAGQQLRIVVPGAASAPAKNVEPAPAEPVAGDASASEQPAPAPDSTPPAVEPAPTQPIPGAQEVMYDVASGDSLSRLAKRYGVTVEQIREWNSLKDDNLLQGQKLRILTTITPLPVAPVVKKKAPTPEVPTPAPAVEPAPPVVEPAPASATETVSTEPETPSENPAAEPQTFTTHKVEAGENWFRLARKYGVTQEKLKEMNGLAPDALLREGVELKVPETPEGDG